MQQHDISLQNDASLNTHTIIHALEKADFYRYTKCILAVSGGTDSIVLLDSIVRYKHKMSSSCLPILTEFVVACVDHNLRQESYEEALFVKEQAQKRGLSCTILSWKPPNYTPLKHTSSQLPNNRWSQIKHKKQTALEEKARLARYQLLWQHADAINANCIVTAHHLNDQWETFIMRLKRGSGLKGLCSPYLRTPIAGIDLLRPFHRISRQDIDNWRELYHLDVKHDATNNDLTQERAQLRFLSTSWQKEGLSLQAIAKTIDRLQSAQHCIENIIEAQWQKYIAIYACGYLDMPMTLLTENDQEISLGILSKALSLIGGHQKCKRQAIHTQHNETLLTRLQNDIKNKTLRRYVGAQTLIYHDTSTKNLRFIREISRNKPPPTILNEKTYTIFDNRFLCTIKPQHKTIYHNTFWSIGYYSRSFFETYYEEYYKNTPNNTSQQQDHVALLCTIPILHCLSSQGQHLYFLPSLEFNKTSMLSYSICYHKEQAQIENIPSDHIPFDIHFTQIHDFLYQDTL